MYGHDCQHLDSERLIGQTQEGDSVRVPLLQNTEAYCYHVTAISGGTSVNVTGNFNAGMKHIVISKSIIKFFFFNFQETKTNQQIVVTLVVVVVVLVMITITVLTILCVCYRLSKYNRYVGSAREDSIHNIYFRTIMIMLQGELYP